MLVRFLVCALMLPAATSGQSSIEIGPLVALYRPVGHYEHTAAFFRVGTPDSPRDNGATAYGGEARVWVNHSFALQLQGVTSTADHPTVFTPGAGPISSSTHVTSATAQVVYAVSPAVTRSRFWVSAGGGAIRHAGSSYEPYGSPTHAVGALGIGSTIALLHGLGASIGVNSLFYRWDLANSNGPYQRGMQTDLLAHAGLTLRLP